MVITDAQVHLWSTNTSERVIESKHTGARLQGLSEFSQDQLIYEMDAAGVARAVIVTPSWEASNKLGLSAAMSDPNRFAVMGRLDISDPKARETLTHWREQPGMLGVRFTNKFQGDDNDNWVWAVAESSHIPIMLSPSSVDPQLLSRVAERHPQLRLIWDHLGLPRRQKDDAAFAFLDRVLILAKYPNIAVKASGLQHYTNDSYPYRRLHQPLRRVYDEFGPKRMFWGTDITEQSCSYRQAVAMFTEELSWLNSDDKEWIMGRGLGEWIGWTVPRG